jgi:hypothetical protein
MQRTRALQIQGVSLHSYRYAWAERARRCGYPERFAQEALGHNTPKPKLRAYPPETVIAEKLEAMVRLGLANSRMKDFFDIWYLARSHSFEGRVLADAIRATFAARNTPLPAGPVTALTPEFSQDQNRRAQWKAFVQQAALSETTPPLPEVVANIADFLAPLLASIQSRSSAPGKWDRSWDGFGQ